MASDDVSETGAADTSDTVRIAYSVAVATTIDLGTAYDGTIENLQVTGAGAFRLTGNAANNVLTGNASANLIDGGAGADTMNGGLGGDTYVVDNLGDVVNEAGAGVDLVKSSVSYTLGANVENLLLTGSDPLNGTGNTLANVLTGNDGDNVLEGLAGNDRLVGGAGNDTYVVLGTDTIVELAGGGTADTVQSATSYSIALLAQVENLTLTGVANVNATGNAAANTLIGNDGNNILDGRGGADIMTGGEGDDLYVLDSESDQVIENPGEGSDTVRILYAPSDSTLDLSTDFGGNIENVEVLPVRAVGNFTGAKFFEITGNAADNRLSANGQVTQLRGGDGNDTLSSGFGNGDNMIGGAGADQFVFDAPYRDTTTSFAYVNFNNKGITDFEPGVDRIALDNDFFPRAALGELDAAAFVSGAGLTHALDNSDRVIYDTTTGNLYYDFDGSASTGGIPWLFATLFNHPTIAASDFEVIN
jgi:Ca2+-binding RTX toxin-like protein